MDKTSKEDLLEANVQITKSGTPAGERIIEYGDAENMLDIYAEQECIAFLDSIREYIHESNANLYYDERTSKEFYDIYKTKQCINTTQKSTA